ncbi:hypothetical protein Hanom_Chr14g01255011 [Helianthus anomalus]
MCNPSMVFLSVYGVLMYTIEVEGCFLYQLFLFYSLISCIWCYVVDIMLQCLFFAHR